MQNRKEKWLNKNEYRRAYFTNRIPLKDIFTITSKTKLSNLETDGDYAWMSQLSSKELKIMTEEATYSPSFETIGDWMIRERVKKTVERRSFNPKAFCWASGKSLFLRKSVLVISEIQGPGDPVVEWFYFKPSQYTLWLLKDD
jgi:hypothetical protein